jgi:hypothetical protein
MLYGIDGFAAIYLLVYASLAILCFVTAFKKFKKYLKKKKQPKLTLIQGGKKESGPHG